MSSEQEFKCVFCSETFSQKEDLQTHFRKHGDPSFKSKKDKRRYSDDNEASTEKAKDQVEVVECDVCPEVFSSISKAITHKHKMHPDHDTKYFCPWCGKLFTMKHLYKKHMNATHSDMEQSEKRFFHCDSCDVDFFVPAAMLYHNKFYHRQDELPNLGHSKKLKMILQEIVQIYYCPFCGEEHENKVNLHKHINEDHCGENRSPDDVFRCPLCDAIFFYLDAYELHLTYHSSEDLYTERNEMIDEITDFSLETVQPLQEKVENAEADNEGAPTSMGIEELLEFTMNDPENNRKSKKHKKHKKSKKAAITLDEFLNMNKDVFGEGIDFQGVEEVPTQVITKRLKTKKVAPTSQVMSPDIAKLKRQGIVVKKQPPKIGKPTMGPKVSIKSAANVQKPVNFTQQTKSNALISTDAVLTRLLNQGSQIKIVKKSNQDTEAQSQQQNNTSQEEEKAEEKTEEVPSSEVDKTETKDIEPSKESENADSPKSNKLKSSEESPNRESPSLINDNEEHTALQNCEDDSNHSAKSNDVSEDHTNTTSKLSNNVIALQNNSNITMKLPKNIATKENNLNNQESNNFKTTETKQPDNTENSVENPLTPTTGHTSLNALKHLSHLITVKSVNTSKAIPLPYEKLDNSQKSEIAKKSPEPQNNSPKTEATPLSNIKKLDGITIKPTNKFNTHSSNNQPSRSEDNIEDTQETDDEWHDDKSKGNMDANKLASVGKSLQLNIETKHSPVTLQKESPKAPLNINQNSQSSADLLKHLKNVTAKPVNTNSQNISTPLSSPNAAVKNTNKTSVQKEICEDGTEIFSIDDSDSDEGHCAKNNIGIKNESKVETNKPMAALKNVSKNITIKSTSQQRETNKTVECCNKTKDDSESDEELLKRPSITESNSKFNCPNPNQKQVAINNVLKNLSKNITVKSRNSSPSQSARSQDSRDSHQDENEAGSDSDTPLSRVKITEMDNMSDEDSPEHAESHPLEDSVKVEHPDDSHSDHDSEPPDEEFDNMSDIEAQIVASKVQKQNSNHNSQLNKLNFNANSSQKSTNNTSPADNERESSPIDEIPAFAKNLSNQISIKQIKRPESKNASVIDQGPRTNQSTVGQKLASASNQVNTFNKEVKTVKTFQTQTKTVIQEITTTVTKTIKTVNQTTKQEVRNMSQLHTSPMITQKVQSLNSNLGQKNFQGVKVRQSVPCVRPKIRGQAPQTTRPAICAPPQPIRPAICAPSKANQLVPVRPVLNRPSGPRPRMPNVMNARPSTSGQPRPQISRPVKISPRAIIAPTKKPAESPGHFSCFKKPKESLIPEPDFSAVNKNDEDSSAHFSSTVQMSKSNFSSTSKMVKGNSVVTSTQTKSEMSASSQQLSKLRGMSGLVVKTSQSQAKQTHVEEKCEMSASKRNALEAIQKLQSQGLLVKKPRLDVSEDSDHSQHGSDDMEHFSNEELDEEM